MTDVKMEEVPPVEPESQGPEGDAAADIKAEIKPETVKEEPAAATNGAEEPAPVAENGSAEAPSTDTAAEVKTEAEAKPAEEAAPAAEAAAEPAAEGEAQAEQSNGDAAASNGDGEANEVFADDKQSMVNSFIEKKLSKKVAARLADVILSLGLNRDDFDDRAIDLLSTFNLESSLFIIKEIEESQLYGVQNRPQYLMAIMRNFKERYRSLGQHSTGVPLIPGPKIETIKSIIDRTHYHLEITVGQRKYHCPPELVNEPTGTDHEVFIGQIPRDVYEDQLIPIFEEVGQIYDLRIMMDPPNGKSRGYAFLVYVNRDHAFEAAKKFNGYEIVPGKPLKVNISVANTRLFIGNIPKSKTKEEILEELKKHAEGVLDVIVYTNPDAADNKKNRGFCFVDFAEHKAASDAKRRIGTGKVRPWNSDLVVDWADQQEEPDEETMSQVKVLYVKNLKEAVTEDKLTEMFKPYGEIERVKKIRDYAFIHYKNREDALKAMEEMKGKVVEGVDVEISLAKPQGESKLRRGKGPTPNAKRANAVIARANARAAAHNTTYNEYYGPPSRGAPRGGAGVPGYGARYPPYAPPAPYGGGYGGAAYDGGYGAYPMASPYSGYDPYGGYTADPYYGTPYAGPSRGSFSSGSFNRSAGGGGRGGRGFSNNRGGGGGGRGGRGRGAKRPGEGQGGPASKRGGRADDFSQDVPMNEF